jgi:hypothetical protein
MRKEREHTLDVGFDRRRAHASSILRPLERPYLIRLSLEAPTLVASRHHLKAQLSWPAWAVLAHGLILAGFRLRLRLVDGLQMIVLDRQALGLAVGLRRPLPRLLGSAELPHSRSDLWPLWHKVLKGYSVEMSRATSGHGRFSNCWARIYRAVA